MRSVIKCTSRYFTFWTSSDMNHVLTHINDRLVRFQLGPYVMQAYFGTQMNMVESRGKVARCLYGFFRLS